MYKSKTLSSKVCRISASSLTNYICNYCNAELSSSYASGHCAKHFQQKEFTDMWLRKHFEEFYRKIEPNLQKYLEESDQVGR